MRNRDEHIGLVIAERRLHVRGAPRRIVTVSLGKPRKTKGSGGEEWECPFQIAGAGIQAIEFGRGVDAFQALTTALEGIRYYLDRSGEVVVWGGVLEDQSGFQRPIPLLPEPGGTRRLERLVDRELQRRLSTLERRHKARTRRRSDR